MAGRSFKVSFELDEADANYFRRLYRTAKQNATEEDSPRIVKDVKGLIDRVRGAEKKPPKFVLDAITTLEDLMQMLEDKDYALPKTVASQALAALAYFANPEDVIPDHIPALGFLDDAIMIKFVEDEFKHELWAYRKFRKFRDGAEHRPWTRTAYDRLPKRLEDYRKSLRSDVKKRKDAEAAKEKRAKAAGRRVGW